MHCVFSFFNRDAANIRNKPEYGGGALMDIGCYPIHASRWIFGTEPRRVSARIERDPEFGIDHTISGLLDFPNGQALFTTSMQMNPWQRVQFFGTKGHIEIEIPFNAPPDRETRIFVRIGTNDRTETFPICDQYTLQGDAFARAILDNTEVPVPLENALGNMKVMEALLKSALWTESYERACCNRYGLQGKLRFLSGSAGKGRQSHHDYAPGSSGSRAQPCREAGEGEESGVGIGQKKTGWKNRNHRRYCQLRL